MRLAPRLLLATVLALSVAATGAEASNLDVQRRVEADVSSGRPVVVHVVVALCDNVNQGIVPVPGKLGDGQSPSTNLYWGAAFGFRSYLLRRGGYELIDEHKPAHSPVLERVVLHTRVNRNGKLRDVFVVAEAWDGREMRAAINRFLTLAAGAAPHSEKVTLQAKQIELASGGSAALVMFIGHNGLMDFRLRAEPHRRPGAPPRSAVVLACSSKLYFEDRLRRIGCNPLILTAGLMAPEAYTADAIITAFAGGGSPGEVRDAAAAAYNRYQQCGLAAAKRLFSTCR